MAAKKNYNRTSQRCPGVNTCFKIPSCESGTYFDTHSELRLAQSLDLKKFDAVSARLAADETCAPCSSKDAGARSCSASRIISCNLNFDLVEGRCVCRAGFTVSSDGWKYIVLQMNTLRLMASPYFSVCRQLHADLR